jgi:hypothetical protein
MAVMLSFYQEAVHQYNCKCYTSYMNPVHESEHPKSSSDDVVMVGSIILFIIFALGVIIFLYNQNQQLKKTLADYQTPVVTITPSPTPDATIDWKVYKNDKYGYEFKCSPSSIHKITLSNGNGTDKPVYEEICYENQNQTTISVFPLKSTISIETFAEGANAQQRDSGKWKIFIRGFDDIYYNQVFSTFKFVSPTPTPSSIPFDTEAPISTKSSSLNIY